MLEQRGFQALETPLTSCHLTESCCGELLSQWLQDFSGFPRDPCSGQRWCGCCCEHWTPVRPQAPYSYQSFSRVCFVTWWDLAHKEENGKPGNSSPRGWREEKAWLHFQEAEKTSVCGSLAPAECLWPDIKCPPVPH